MEVFPLNLFHIAQRLYVQVLCTDESGLRRLIPPSYMLHEFLDFLIFFERSDARTPISEIAVVSVDARKAGLALQCCSQCIHMYPENFSKLGYTSILQTGTAR